MLRKNLPSLRVKISRGSGAGTHPSFSASRQEAEARGLHRETLSGKTTQTEDTILTVFMFSS